MAFLKTILIILLIYYGLKIVVKMFAPKIFGYAVKKTEKHFKEKFGEFAQQSPRNEQRVGDVIIDKKTSGAYHFKKRCFQYRWRLYRF